METKIGEPGYVNKNCWLAKNLGYPPAKRCQYCESKFPDCLFFRYLIITLALVLLIFTASVLLNENISRLVTVSIFALVIVYGYFFSRSTEDIIIANFAQRKAKESFEDLSRTLQQKVNEQTRDIKEAYEIEKKAHDDLVKLDEAKTDFMLVTQHHLRTPLSITMGFFDLLLSGHFGKIPKKMLSALQKSNDSVRKEIGIVNDLLNVSSFQLGHGSVQLEPHVSVKKILEGIADDLKQEACNRKLYLKFKAENDIPEIKADRQQLKMAMQNIIDNALKYTKEGGVEVKIKAEGDKMKIEVKDTGIGMDDKEKKRLFEKPFQRSKEAWAINAIGKGIGVYLSAQIIKAHGGKIRADSEGLGRGSIFSIELPINSISHINN